MVPSMSRRGNCHDSAVAENFFSALKKERIKRQIYPTRQAAASDAFNYIEMFYSTIRRHGSAGDLPPVEFERRHAQNGSYSVHETLAGPGVDTTHPYSQIILGGHLDGRAIRVLLKCRSCLISSSARRQWRHHAQPPQALTRSVRFIP